MPKSTPNDSVLDLTLRGVEMRDETVAYVRRSCQHLHHMLPRSGEPMSVLLIRPDSSLVVRAFVWLSEEDEPKMGHGDDPDELRAVHSAFADLRRRLAAMPPTPPTAPSSRDRSTGPSMGPHTPSA